MRNKHSLVYGGGRPLCHGHPPQTLKIKNMKTVLSKTCFQTAQKRVFLSVIFATFSRGHALGPPWQGRGNRPPHPPAGGAPAMSRGPASVAILLLFYFFNFENYNLYFHDQLSRAAGWNRGGASTQPSSPLCVVPRPSLTYRPGSENKMAEQTGQHCRSGDEVKYDFCYEFLWCS